MEEPEKTRAIRNEKGQFVPDASGFPIANARCRFNRLTGLTVNEDSPFK
jgi:hypothetical protein